MPSKIFIFGLVFSHPFTFNASGGHEPRVVAVKLIIQIPCYNEEGTLPATLADLPREISGIDIIETMVVDDGSSDRTVAVAHELGVNHILQNKQNLGLAASFRRGLEACLELGADIIVNTDGDNQYRGGDIPQLVAPILRGECDVVIGDRQTAKVSHFSPMKRLLQRVGSSVVRRFSGVNVPDAVSGFRAISRDAAISLNIVSSFSYTIEMLIQVGRKGLACRSVPIRTNPKTRDSRLFKSTTQFLKRSVATLLRMYAMYSPLKVFASIGLFVAFLGLIPMTRFLYFYFFVSGSGKIQSLVVGSALLTIGTITFIVGILADLVNYNRKLLEMILTRIRLIEQDSKLLDPTPTSNSSTFDRDYIIAEVN